MKLIRSMPAVLALAALASPLASRADHTCATDIIIFSYPASVNSNVVKCTLDTSDDVDGRLINPGSTSVSVRFTGAADGDTLTAILNGLGFVNKSITLRSEPGTVPGTFAYDSASIAIPGGRTASGCLTATLPTIVEDIDENGDPIPAMTGFHTVGAACTDV